MEHYVIFPSRLVLSTNIKWVSLDIFLPDYTMNITQFTSLNGKAISYKEKYFLGSNPGVNGLVFLKDYGLVV